jgi:hypothetical protein
MFAVKKVSERNEDCTFQPLYVRVGYLKVVLSIPNTPHPKARSGYVHYLTGVATITDALALKTP